MIKTTILTILFILSSSSVTVACADTSFVSYNATSTKIGSSDFIEQVKSIENPERFRSVCNNQKKAEYCFNYAAYQDIVLDNYQLAYKYHMKAFDLGEKESGVLIGHYQINYPERFDVDNRLRIDREYGVAIGLNRYSKIDYKNEQRLSKEGEQKLVEKIECLNEKLDFEAESADVSILAPCIG